MSCLDSEALSEKHYAIYSSSNWADLEPWHLLLIDDLISSGLDKLGTFKDAVACLSGWHFSQILRWPTLFPEMNRIFSRFSIDSIERLIERSRFDLGRYFGRHPAVGCLAFDELISLMEHPILLSLRGRMYGRGDPEPKPEKILDKELQRIRSTPLMELFSGTLSKYPDRTQQVIRLRVGIEGRRHTLEEIAKLLGVTRERVRQIESKFYKRSEKAERWDDELREKLHKIYSGSDKPLGLVALEISDPWFRGISSQPLVFEAILNKYNNNVESDLNFYVNFNFGSEPILTVDRDEDLEKIVLEAKSIIRKLSSNSISSRSNIESIASALCPNSFKIYVNLFVGRVLEEFNAPVAQDDDENIFLMRDSRRARINSIIKSRSHEEWTVQRINKEGKRLFDIDFSHRDIQASLGDFSQAGMLVQVGRGRYVYPSAMCLTDSDLDLVNDEIIQIMKSKNSLRQWHCQELYDQCSNSIRALLKYKEYSIYYAAGLSDGRIVCLGRLIVGDPVHFKGVVDRYDIADLIYNVLTEAGRPLRQSEIRRRVLVTRGLGRNFQIHPDRKIIQVAPGFFGLKEWEDWS